MLREYNEWVPKIRKRQKKQKENKKENIKTKKI
jgi:hypothetical protein